jgi:pilus assembly protein CpaC
MVEFRSSKLRELGIRWNPDINGPNAGLVADFATNSLFRARPPAGDTGGLGDIPLPGRVSPPKAYLGWITAIDSRLRLLEEEGEATVVAEPTLSCRSGGSARFVSGGEIPIPIVDGLGSTDVEFKEYGVILDVKPVVDSTGGIVARVDTEVSQIDESQRVLGVPGFLKRSSAADVRLRAGETLVIAGLVNRTRSDSTAGVPGLRRAPVVGRAFRQRGKRDEQTELVVFLTPSLVDALPQSSAEQDQAERERAEQLRRARERIATWGARPAAQSTDPPPAARSRARSVPDAAP